MNRYTIWIATAAITLWAPLAWGDSLTSESFAKQAAAAGNGEVALSQIAVERAANAEVKRFAQTMIDDHKKANDELKSLSHQEKITLPDEPTAEQRAAADRLRQQSGSSFDKAYVQQMLADHQKAVDLFRKASADNGVDTNLRQFAGKTLPTLEHHLQEVQDLSSDVGNASRQSSR